jgi:hypothetical protein
MTGSDAFELYCDVLVRLHVFSYVDLAERAAADFVADDELVS